jgi:hypothetical protein
MIQRREFIAGLGSAAAWPGATRAQQPSQGRRIGVLSTLGADDPDKQSVYFYRRAASGACRSPAN